MICFPSLRPIERSAFRIDAKVVTAVGCLGAAGRDQSSTCSDNAKASSTSTPR